VRVRGEGPRDSLRLRELLDLLLLVLLRGVGGGGGRAVGRVRLDLVLEVVLELLQPPGHHLSV
jgi:hypothetical protein